MPIIIKPKKANNQGFFNVSPTCLITLPVIPKNPLFEGQKLYNSHYSLGTDVPVAGEES